MAVGGDEPVERSARGVANALVDDLEIQAGCGGRDAPRFDNCGLTVEEE